jgi:hypothetical protein
MDDHLLLLPEKMNTPKNSSTDVHKKSVVRKARWVGQFGPSQIEEQVEQTQPQGKSMKNDNKKFTIYITPVQKANSETSYAHQLIEIHSNKDTMTKGQAKEAISKILGIQLADDFIIKHLLKKHDHFIEDAWKNFNPLRSDHEHKILNCIKELEAENYVVTKEILYKRLRTRESAYFTQQNRALIETIIRSPEYFSSKVTIPEKVDHNMNFLNVAKIAATFARILDSAIETNGFDTSHSKFKNLIFSDMTLAIIMIAILPMVAHRTKIPDNLPALYFYGQARTGKSHFFNQHPAYHQVATDADGVSRYQLQTNEDAFLLDDITQKILDDKRNCSTIRNLALGGTATVKISGNTQKVRGFVVCTSNDTPGFLDKKMKDPDIEANCTAWRRRFISIKFTSPVDEDPLNAQYEYTSANNALICFFFLMLQLDKRSRGQGNVQ